MKQEKLVRKFLPVEPFDMCGLEEWLSSMAARGLHLAKINQDRACFRPGPPSGRGTVCSGHHRTDGH